MDKNEFETNSLQTLANNYNIAIWQYNRENDKLHRYFSDNQETKTPKQWIEDKYVHQKSVDECIDLFDRAHQCDSKVSANLLLKDDYKEEYVYCDISITPFFDDDKKYLYSVVTRLTLSSSVQFANNNLLDKSLRISLDTDQLTGLKNRHFYVNKIEEINQNNIYPVNVLMLDINGLKLINDIYGHVTGDRLLIEVANIIRSNTDQNTDAIRISGDEFIVLQFAPPTEGKKLLDKIINRVDQIVFRDIFISISGGLSHKTAPYQSIENVVKEAEDKMYEIKLLKSNKYHQMVISSILEKIHVEFPAGWQHLLHVSFYMQKYAQKSGFSEDVITHYGKAGMLHGIGRITIDPKLILQPKRLNSGEYAEILEHPIAGYRILKNIGIYSEILGAMLYLHEHYDGTGYPHKRKGKDIPEMARALTICEAYDKMLTGFNQEKKFTLEETYKELRQQSGLMFDPEIVKFLIANIKPCPEKLQAVKCSNDFDLIAKVD